MTCNANYLQALFVTTCRVRAEDTRTVLHGILARHTLVGDHRRALGKSGANNRSIEIETLRFDEVENVEMIHRQCVYC